MADVVNGQRWAAGYTGTMLQHGRAVPASSAQVGDLVIYGSGAPGQHVAVCLGNGLVFSHGSEAGPFKLALRYRSDVLSVRRYF
ncbi:MAG: NlpC/P60 family protein [Jatrophihabitantaceae bacterium]